MHSGYQIDKEAKHVEGEDERDRPLQDAGRVVFVLEIAHAEGDCEHDFHQDEGELYPEGDAQNTVLAEMYAKALVFPADEDGGDDEAGDEEEEKDIVKGGMSKRIENRKKNEARGSDNCEPHTQSTEHLLREGGVPGQPAAMPQPSFREK